ncbi:hypothetical protein Tco_0514578 [Tanacetum coccineum]
MYNNIMAAGSKDQPPMLGPGRYSQWRSRFLWYIDTKLNGGRLKKSILSGPYMPTTVQVQAVKAAEGRPAVPQHTSVETILNMTPENKEHFQSEKEAIFLLLTGIGDEIYSTVDACKTTNEMWIAIERLQRGESLNVQDPKWQPLALIAAAQPYSDNYYQAPKPQRSNATSSSTRPSASTRHKGKEIAKPITPQSESVSVSDEDSDPEQAQRDKEMQKNLALLAKYFKKLYKPTNNNLRTSSNSRNKTEDTTPSIVVVIVVEESFVVAHFVDVGDFKIGGYYWYCEEEIEFCDDGVDEFQEDECCGSEMASSSSSFSYLIRFHRGGVFIRDPFSYDYEMLSEIPNVDMSGMNFIGFVKLLVSECSSDIKRSQQHVGNAEHNDDSDSDLDDIFVYDNESEENETASVHHLSDGYINGLPRDEYAEKDVSAKKDMSAKKYVSAEKDVSGEDNLGDHWPIHDHAIKWKLMRPVLGLLNMKYKCKVNISQARRGKMKALQKYETCLEDHYGMLRSYASKILNSNLDSTCKMSVDSMPDGKNYFSRFYVCFKGLREGWLQGCRRVIGIDGCFLKTICKGEPLSAVGIDGNNQIYPC